MTVEQLMNLPYDYARCPGSYANVHGEFGKVIKRECIECLRRTPCNPERQAYMQPPEFEVGCPKKITESE
jgi:hypothetical protein